MWFDFSWGPRFFTSHHFDRIWAVALSGLLKHAYMVLTVPRHQSAFVLNISLSPHPEE
jgi:hypothetical protein